MATKHQQIIAFIRDLEIGNKISVRQIAKKLDVSEGTAYRAIKDAENQGLVSTIGRVGTIRIEQKQKTNIEHLTLAEVVNIVEGTVIGGSEGLHKSLHKFVIGAMQKDEMMKYVEAQSLLIVGNRVDVHEQALRQGAAVLITGGFDTDEEVKQLADEYKLPIISSSYDTFTVATMINRAIDDRLIKKQIMVAEDILISRDNTYCLSISSTVRDWYQLSRQTQHGRFPVIDESSRVMGIVTAKDIMDHGEHIRISRVMTKDPIIVTAKTSVASVAHIMIWEGIELIPVVDEQRKLHGVVSRQDVLKALQYVHNQPQIGQTYEDQITSSFVEGQDARGFYLRGEVTPQMTNNFGTISSGVYTVLMTNAGHRMLRRYRKRKLVAENMTVYFIRPVQMENTVMVRPQLLELSRKFGKVEISVYHDGDLVAKSFMTAQLID